jgi:Protein of unknown function (DUF1161)
MRKVALLFFLALTSLPAMAEILTCDALKARVDIKLQAKGVQSYTLEITPAKGSNDTADTTPAVPGSKITKGKEVGTCDGGTKRLIYIKGH